VIRGNKQVSWRFGVVGSAKGVHKSPDLGFKVNRRQPRSCLSLAITLLSCLVKHVPAQREAISKRSVVDSTTEICAGWTKFRGALWGKGLKSLEGEELVERNDNPIKAVPILPPTTGSVATPPKHIPCLEHAQSKALGVVQTQRS